MVLGMNPRGLVITLSFLFALALSPSCQAQPAEEQTTVNLNGDSGHVHKNSEYVLDTAVKLLAALPAAGEQAAVNVASMLERAKTDPETNLLLRRLKEQDALNALAQDMNDEKIAKQLIQTVQEMEMTEKLFKMNPKRAVEEMKIEGMLPPNKVKQYEKDPQLLADSTMKSLYFTLITTAAAGGYL